MLLLLLLAACDFGLICLWSWRQSRLWKRAVWTGLGMTPLLVGLSYAVVTPCEQIIDRCRALAGMVDEGDVAGLGFTLADDFEAGGLDRTDFLDRLRRMLTRYRVDALRLSSFTVALPREDEGIAEFDAFCNLRSREALFQQSLTRWRVSFRHRGESWDITGIEPLHAPPFSPFRHLRDWIR